MPAGRPGRLLRATPALPQAWLLVSGGFPYRSLGQMHRAPKTKNISIEIKIIIKYFLVSYLLVLYMNLKYFKN
jgi:hypothetical protein